MKERNSSVPPAQLLISYQSTPTSSAAYAVNEAIRSAADSDVLDAVDSAVGRVFYSAVYEPVYIETWCAVFATWRTKQEIHLEHNAAAPGKRGKPQRWGFTIALVILGGLLAPSRPSQKSLRPTLPTPAYVFSDPNYGLTPTRRSAATPEPLANVPATGKVIEHGGGYWQWDGQEWNPVPRAIPVGREL